MTNLSKRTTPMVGKLSELLVSGKQFGLLEAGPRPELAIHSPRGLKNFDVGVVGLGIVAALEKFGDHVLLAKHSTAAAANRSRSRSNPIPVKSRDCYRQFDEDDEDYTFVTCHGLNDKSYTKVYYDGGEIARASINSVKSKRTTSDSQKKRNDIFSIASTSCSEDRHSHGLFPASDFLSSCHLCKKKLHGKDIYMYRGEKAFCSSECRASQILTDERKEQCRSEAARSVVEHASTSSYSRDQILSTGIVAI